MGDSCLAGELVIRSKSSLSEPLNIAFCSYLTSFASRLSLNCSSYMLLASLAKSFEKSSADSSRLAMCRCMKWPELVLRALSIISSWLSLFSALLCSETSWSWPTREMSTTASFKFNSALLNGNGLSSVRRSKFELSGL